MNNIKIEEIREDMIVYYIPSHCDKNMTNAEAGRVSTINENGIWVRYTTGDTGAKTNLCDLYLKGKDDEN